MILQLAVRQIDRLSCENGELLGQLRALTDRFQSMQQETLLQRGGGERASPQRQAAARPPPAPMQSLAPTLHPHIDEPHAHETRPAVTVVAGRPGARVGVSVGTHGTAPLPIRKRRPPPSGGNQSSTTRAQQAQLAQQQQQHQQQQQQVPTGPSTVFSPEEPPQIIFSISAMPSSSSSAPAQLVQQPESSGSSLSLSEAASSSEQRHHSLMKLQQGIQHLTNNLDTDELKLRALTSSSSSSNAIVGPSIGCAPPDCGPSILVNVNPPQRCCQPLSIAPTKIEEQLLGVSDHEIDDTDLELQLATTLGPEALIADADMQQRRPSTSTSISNATVGSSTRSVKSRSPRLPSGASQTRPRGPVRSPKLNTKRRNPSGSSLSGQQPPSPSRRRRNTSSTRAQPTQPVGAVVVSTAPVATAPVGRSQLVRRMEPVSIVATAHAHTPSVPVPTVIRAQHSHSAIASNPSSAPAPASAHSQAFSSRDAAFKDKVHVCKAPATATPLQLPSLQPSSATFAAPAPGSTPIIYLAHGFQSSASPQLLTSLPFPMPVASPVPVNSLYNMAPFEPGAASTPGVVAHASHAAAAAAPAAGGQPFPLHYPVLLQSPLVHAAPLVAHSAPVRQLVSPVAVDHIHSDGHHHHQQPQQPPQQHLLTAAPSPVGAPVRRVHSVYKASSSLLPAPGVSAATSVDALPQGLQVQAAPLVEARQSAREQTLDAIIEAIRHVEGTDQFAGSSAPPE